MKKDEKKALKPVELEKAQKELKLPLKVFWLSIACILLWMLVSVIFAASEAVFIISCIFITASLFLLTVMVFVLLKKTPVLFKDISQEIPVFSVFALIFPFKFAATVYGKAREVLKKTQQIFKAI